MTEKKHPLIAVDSDGQIRRIQFTSHEDKPLFIRMLCPLGNKFCSYHCAAVALAVFKDDDYGLVCDAFHRTIPLGILDNERIDLDVLDALKFGTDLRDEHAADDGN